MADSTIPASGDTSLSERLQNLPQELFDFIHDLVFSFEYNNEADIEITPLYKPPFQLQINYSFRIAFADEYYRKTTFSFTSRQLLYQWLFALPPGVGHHFHWLRAKPSDPKYIIGSGDSGPEKPHNGLLLRLDQGPPVYRGPIRLLTARSRRTSRTREWPDEAGHGSDDESVWDPLGTYNKISSAITIIKPLWQPASPVARS